MKKISKIISNISENFIKILFTFIIAGMLIINSVYLYTDMPAFKINNIFNYIGILINVLLFLGLIVIDKLVIGKYFKKRYIDIIIFLIYFVIEYIYIKIVPLKPFSDMQYVTEIALSNFKNNIDYLKIYPNNLPIAIIFNLIFRITSYKIIYIKIFNIICNILIIFFAQSIYKNIYKKESRIILLFGIFNFAPIIYVNHIYNDIIFVTIVMFAIFLITKNNESKFDIWLISISLFLQYIIRPVGIIIIIASTMYYILKNKNVKNVLIILSVFVLCNIVYLQIEKRILANSEEKYPIWSFIQMGLNEEEFGFQDGTHSKEWTFKDVQNRIQELGPIRLLKLLCKKQYWLWTEGTYQAERYAFGYGSAERFEYQTGITEEIEDVENSIIKKTLEYIMKGQYLIFIILAFLDLIIIDKDKEIEDKKEFLLYIIIGLFCFYTIWEMKSRYIYVLYPIFLILSTEGTQKLLNEINKRRNLK